MTQGKLFGYFTEKKYPEMNLMKTMVCFVEWGEKNGRNGGCPVLTFLAFGGKMSYICSG